MNINTTGVYKILNLITHDCYIGHSVNIFQRYYHHKYLLKTNRHHSIHLQRAWNKYGAANFILVILEECNSKVCVDREQYYLDTCRPAYNIAKKANSRFGVLASAETKLLQSRIRTGKKFTQEHRRNLSNAISTTRFKKGMTPWNKGQKWNNEIRQKMSIAQSGERSIWFGKHHTEETKLKMSLAQKGRPKLRRSG